jgi:hypothetical protein
MRMDVTPSGFGEISEDKASESALVGLLLRTVTLEYLIIMWEINVSD